MKVLRRVEIEYVLTTLLWIGAIVLAFIWYVCI